MKSKSLSMKPRNLLIGVVFFTISGICSAINAQQIEKFTSTFQNGLNGYEGTFEKRISPGGISDSGADFQEYYLDGSSFFPDHVQNDIMELIRFDGIVGSGENQIPAGSTIISAKLQFHTGTDSNAVSDGPWMIGILNEAVTIDTQYADLDLQPDIPEFRGARNISGRPLLSGYADISTLEVVAADVTKAVQAWVNGDENHGLTIFANDTTNGWQFSTIGNEDISKRPALVVEYTTAPIKVFEFTASKSAVINNIAPTINGDVTAVSFLDGGPDDIREVLVRFDSIFGEEENQIKDFDQIIKAELIVHTSGSPEFSADADSDDPYFVHQLLVDWDLTTNFGASGPTTAAAQINEAVGEFIGMGEFAEATADMTSIVSNWKAGQSNFGVNIKPGGQDGWQIFLNGASDSSLVPTLRVLTFELSGTPTAEFSVSGSEGEAPFTLVFNAENSRDPRGQSLTFKWDFADGSSAEGVSVSHTFENPGIYDVSLTVSNEVGAESVAIKSIKSLGMPTAQLTANTDIGPAPLTLALTAEGSIDTDGGLIEYLWNFGNGQTSNLQETQAYYSAAGIYTVTLTVTDDEGRTQKASHQLTVLPTNVQTVEFQQGHMDYQGTLQKRVSFGGINENGQDVTQYYLDGRPQDEEQIANDTIDLIRFDGIIGNGSGLIPAGSQVVKAFLTYHTGDASAAASDGPWVIGRMVDSFNELTTYQDLDQSQDSPETRGPRGAVERTQLVAGYADIATLEVVTADISPIVQAWVNGDPNHGLAVYTDDTANGWQIKTVGNEVIAARPKLTVHFTTSETNQYTFFPARSTRINNNGDTLDGEFLFYEFLDGGPDNITEALFQFIDIFGDDDDQIGDDERILSATFITRTGGVPDSSVNADADDPYSIHQMLEEWDSVSTFGPTGPTVENGQIGPRVSAFLGMGEKSQARADITPILYNWQNGAPLFGINVKPQGEDGWQLVWPGSFDFDQMPQLFVLTEPAIPFNPPSFVAISGVSVSGPNTITISWSSRENQVFTIQSSRDLKLWTSTEASWPSEGSTTSYSIGVSDSPDEHLFIRVLEQ